MSIPDRPPTRFKVGDLAIVIRSRRYAGQIVAITSDLEWHGLHYAFGVLKPSWVHRVNLPPEKNGVLIAFPPEALKPYLEGDPDGKSTEVDSAAPWLRDLCRGKISKKTERV